MRRCAPPLLDLRGRWKNKQVNVVHMDGSCWRGGCRKVNGKVQGRGHSKGNTRRHSPLLSSPMSDSRLGQEAVHSHSRHQPPPPSLPTAASPPGMGSGGDSSFTSQRPGQNSGLWCSQGWSHLASVSWTRALCFSEPWSHNSCWA